MSRREKGAERALKKSSDWTGQSVFGQLSVCPVETKQGSQGPEGEL